MTRVVRELEEALQDARERLVEQWHRASGDHGQLHDFLGLSWEDYAAWVERGTTRECSASASPTGELSREERAALLKFAQTDQQLRAEVLTKEEYTLAQSALLGLEISLVAEPGSRDDPDETRADLMDELVPKMMERAESLTWVVSGSTLDKHYAMHELLLLVLEHPQVAVEPGPRPASSKDVS